MKMKFNLWYPISKMGGLCSKSGTLSGNNNTSHQTGILMEPNTTMKRRLNEPFSRQDENKEMTAILGSNPDGINPSIAGMNVDEVDLDIPQMSMDFLQDCNKPTKSKHVAKVSEMSTLLGKAGGKAVEVLDTLGSGMTSLHHSGGFVSGVTTKGNKISILAFEVANTIVKGANLMHSLSQENITHLKKVVLRSHAVQTLISKDIDQLLTIAAADKREELKVFSGEVVRFGNRCKDHQYHNLDRYFAKLGSERSQNPMKDQVEAVMQNLMTLVQYTAELYHELHSLDRYEQDYQRKLQEEDKVCPIQRGNGLAILRAELKSQRKHVKSLKKKSLWSKILEEVMEKLVDIVHFLHLEIDEAFGIVDDNTCMRSPSSGNQRLGSAGLALHYANIITQIDTLVSRSTSIPPNMRDTLYQALPPTVTSALRNKLHAFQLNEELTISDIKVEMDKTLLWLLPIAANTTKAHHGFGWVGEWANTGTELNGKPTLQDEVLRLETLYHADKAKMDILILDLIVWLHQLIIQSKTITSETQSPMKSPFTPHKTIHLSSQMTIIPSTNVSSLSVEDQEMLRDVTKRKVTPGISKSQEFDTCKYRLPKHHRLCKSSNHSPTRECKREVYSTRRPSSVPIINFSIDRVRALDVIDRVDSL